MKKIFISLALVLTLFRSYADEGMWLPMLLGQQVYNDMVKRGLKLKPEQLYSINKSSIKDAIIIFGGGCTGEIVSDQGLIFTNHHCGYSAIAAASTTQNNYLQDGFWASDKTKEISNFTIDFSKQKETLRQQFEELNAIALQTDKSFSGAVKAQEAKQIKGLEHLERRLLKAEKKSHADYLQRIEALQQHLICLPIQGIMINLSRFQHPKSVIGA